MQKEIFGMYLRFSSWLSAELCSCANRMQSGLFRRFYIVGTVTLTQEHVSYEFIRYYFSLLIHSFPALVDISFLWTRTFMIFKRFLKILIDRTQQNTKIHMTYITCKGTKSANYIIISIWCVWIIKALEILLLIHSYLVTCLSYIWSIYLSTEKEREKEMGYILFSLL